MKHFVNDEWITFDYYTARTLGAFYFRSLKTLGAFLKRGVHGPCLDRRTLDPSPTSAEQQRRCCKLGRVVQTLSELASAELPPAVVRTNGKVLQMGRKVREPSPD